MTTDHLPRWTRESLRKAYRRWLLEEARREVVSGCARLLSIPCDFTVLLREAISTWTVERTLAEMESAIRLIARDEEALGPEVKAALATGNQFPLSLLWIPSATLDDLRRREREGAFEIDKTRLRALVRERLTPLIGQGIAAGPLRYVTHVADVTVYTDIDFSPRHPAKLAYEQLVIRGHVGPDSVGYADEAVILPGISPFALMGLSCAEWSYIANADLPRVADQLTEHCLATIRAVPEILHRAGDELATTNGQT